MLLEEACYPLLTEFLSSGKTKLKELTQFFDSVLDGSAELKPVKPKAETSDESAEPPKDEL